MTREQAIEVLYNALYGGGNAFVMSEFRDAIKLALGTLKQERAPENVETGAHPFLPSDINEAAEEQYPDFSNDITSKAAVDSMRDAFKAGAEWMAGQGVILNLSIDELSCGAYNACVQQGLTSEDDVIVQIRKKKA